MKAYGISAIPYSHPDLNIWRANFEGIQYLHKKTNLYITGAIDDVWINPKGELIVVDYKATSKDDEVNIDADWQMGYKRQMEVYQWLLRKNGFKVSNTGYFVYCNGKKDRKAFDAKLEFDIKVIPYKGNDGWIEGAIGEIKKCLEGGASEGVAGKHDGAVVDAKNAVPPYTEGCEWCEYQKEILELNS